MLPTVTLKGIWAALIALAFAILLGLLVVQTVRLEGFKFPLLFWSVNYTGALERAEDAKAAAAACEVRHAVTRGSLDKLQGRLSAMIEDGRARDKRQQEALQEQEGRSAALDSQIASIRAERGPPPVGQECKSPAAVLEAEGL
jgi:hypothetical protein